LIDSLNNTINSQNPHDTALADAYVELAEALYMSNIDTMIPLCNKSIVIAEKSLKNKTSPKVKTSLKKILARSLHDIAYIHKQRGAIPEALNYYHRSFKIREENKDLTGMASSLTNLGVIYLRQGDTTKALDYYTQGFELRKKTGSKNGMAVCLNNIGYIYKVQKNYSKAMELYNQSLVLYNETKNKRGIAMIYNNIGSIYDKQGNSSKGLDYILKSIKMKEEIGYQRGVAVSMANVGNIYLDNNQLSKAKSYGLKSFNLGKKIGYPSQIESAADLLSKVYERNGNYKAALEMHKLKITMRDSVLSEKNQSEATEQKFKYAYEKQAAADSIKSVEAKKVTDAKIETQKAQIKQTQIQNIALYGGVTVLLIFGGFMYTRFRISSRQNKIIEEQKLDVENARDLLEEKNTEITDSIQYAKRIQNAILPPAKIVKEHLKESFILYKPKDVVAGDFYWMENKNGKVLFAAADCTGHGVPGAMVSVVCNNALNRSVREYGLTDPGKILDKTREIVIQEFDKSEEEVKDGMDIALCSIEGFKLQYAGAHNPLWIIRNGKILETKANKQPIGQFDNQEDYTTHNFDLEPGDSLYIFSDGYVDQFGGEKGKKFKTNSFRELLLSIQNKCMEEQKSIIDNSFETWKGNLEQIDDVCIIGVRV
jgi:serine phosphatase RsbU (regulator of sigma subunit)/tetratricopeptide (TPR) repeat protein